jgi:hypothetical protein
MSANPKGLTMTDLTEKILALKIEHSPEWYAEMRKGLAEAVELARERDRERGRHVLDGDRESRTVPR